MLVTDREPIVVCYNVVRKVLSRGLAIPRSVRVEDR